MLQLFQTILFTTTIVLQAPPAGPVPGFEIVQITDDPDWDNTVVLNRCGEIVYSKRVDQSFEGEEIFRYDNGLTVQVTNDNIRDALPHINDHGAMTWVHGADGFVQGDVMVVEEGKSFTIGVGQNPVINNAGHVAFVRFDGTGCGAVDSEVYLYDGSKVQQISNIGMSNQVARMNDLDTIVWVRFDFCVSPWTSEIMMWSDGEITQLTENLIEPNAPEINNLGQIAFSSKEPTDAGLQSSLKLSEGGRITQLSDWGHGPDINDSGTIAFNRWHSDSGNWQVWYHRDGKFFQITDDPFWNRDPSINERGEIAWKARNFPDDDIMYMRRIRTGEADFDGHIDLRDAAAFQNCMTGPGDFDGTTGGFDRLCDCRFLDIDHDRDVDRDDYALFATAMTGPE